jgi:hypothetical protein
MDRQPGRDQLRLARLQGERRIDARAQVEAGGARCRVMRQLVAQSGVENLHIHLHFRRDLVS